MGFCLAHEGYWTGRPGGTSALLKHGLYITPHDSGVVSHKKRHRLTDSPDKLLIFISVLRTATVELTRVDEIPLAFDREIHDNLQIKLLRIFRCV